MSPTFPLPLTQIQEEANRAHEMAVTSLEDTVRSLEQKCIDAEENNINLKKEVEELRELEKAHIRKNQERGHKSTQTAVRGNEIVIGNDGKDEQQKSISKHYPVSPYSVKLPMIIFMHFPFLFSIYCTCLWCY